MTDDDRALTGLLTPGATLHRLARTSTPVRALLGELHPAGASVR